MAKKKENTNANAQEKVTVIIPKPRNITGDTETTVTVNGVMYQIQYDKPVKVPRNVAEVIRQSNEMQAKIEKEIENAVFVPGKPAVAEL